MKNATIAMGLVHSGYQAHLTFRPTKKQGTRSPLTARVSPADFSSRRRGARAGVVEERGGVMRSQIQGVGGEGAHRSGLAAVRCSAVEEKLAVEWTGGRRGSSSGRRGIA
jgi:hypothetical protein